MAVVKRRVSPSVGKGYSLLRVSSCVLSLPELLCNRALDQGRLVRPCVRECEYIPVYTSLLTRPCQQSESLFQSMEEGAGQNYWYVDEKKQKSRQYYHFHDGPSSDEGER